jgi:hypothetical protein
MRADNAGLHVDPRSRACSRPRSVRPGETGAPGSSAPPDPRAEVHRKSNRDPSSLGNTTTAPGNTTFAPARRPTRRTARGLARARGVWRSARAQSAASTGPRSIGPVPPGPPVTVSAGSAGITAGSASGASAIDSATLRVCPPVRRSAHRPTVCTAGRGGGRSAGYGRVRWATVDPFWPEAGAGGPGSASGATRRRGPRTRDARPGGQNREHRGLCDPGHHAARTSCCGQPRRPAARCAVPPTARGRPRRGAAGGDDPHRSTSRTNNNRSERRTARRTTV